MIERDAKTIKDYGVFLKKDILKQILEPIVIKILLMALVIIFQCASWFLCSYLIYTYGGQYGNMEVWYNLPVIFCSFVFLGVGSLFLSLAVSEFILYEGN
jgi:hypothetical protein